MKKLFVIIFPFMLALLSCKKSNQWDNRLNGVWIEEQSSQYKALPSNCALKFNEGEMQICDESVSKDLTRKSRVHAYQGKIWISYKLAMKKHEEYRYDYLVDKNTLWIIENTSTDFAGVEQVSKGKKYHRAK